MAEKTFLSPAVSTREIDLSQPTKLQPSGIPAGVVGVARRGPAFVPVTVATFQDFVAQFGNTDGEAFGPLAMHEWMRNASAGTYVRLLGVGDAKARTTDGNVKNAGFIVGAAGVQDNGMTGKNPYAYEGAQLGRSYILGCFMSQSAGSTYFSDAGLQEAGVNKARAVARGIIFFASGVVPTLNTRNRSHALNLPLATGVGTDGKGPQGVIGRGSCFGDVMTGSDGSLQEFVLLLNGLKESDSYLPIITASFEPTAPNNFANMLNTDPTKIEEAGHFLYADWQVGKSYAIPTGSGVTPYTDGGGPAVADPSFDARVKTAFIVPASGSRNTAVATSATQVGVPNLEGFDDRFRTAFSPFVVSQKFGGKNENLFRIHALDDGQAGSDTFKITISNIIASTNENRKFGSFDLAVRRFDDSDAEPKVLEKFNKIDLDPSSDRYVARVIGDTHTFYDFDKKAGGQKLVVDGLYSNASQYIRVETSQKLDDESIDESALPTGFRGLHHLVTSGTSTTGYSLYGGSPDAMTGSLFPHSRLTGSLANDLDAEIDVFHSSSLIPLTQLPIPFRENIAKGTGPKKRAQASLTWGIQFEEKSSILARPNKLQRLDRSVRSFVKYFPHHLETNQNILVGNNEGTPDVGGSILDADRFNNNLFTLEKLQIITGSNGFPDVSQWAAATYRRGGTATATMKDTFEVASDKSRLLQASKDFTHLPSRKFLKFTFPLQGGFDGVNIFNKDKAKFTDNAVRREMGDASSQGGTSGPTVAAYRKAIDVMEQKSDVDIQILVTPGIRHESVTDFAMDSVERRFDALYILDIEEKDTLDSFVTSSSDQLINVSNTVSRFTNRNLDTSFAAAYFPDVVITDPNTDTNVQCPPSVAVLGAISLNDSLKHPWFAPAGFTRGALSSVKESQVKLNQSNLDELYEADINPLAKFAHDPRVAVFGQKTLLANASALDRVNVRRLLIEVRRKVKAVANTLLFEPNRADTLARFSSSVTPILTTIQSQQGLDRFKVQIDTSTTTQADVENNTIRGKIFLQPTRAVEFISLDFVVTNAGADI
jgi:phage tail sheath protein FI